MSSPPLDWSRWLIAIAAVAGYVGLYFGVAAHTPAPSRTLSTPLDGIVPFREGAIWIYASVYPAILGPIFLVRSQVRFHRIALAVIAVVVICVIGFVLLPVETTSLRPPSPLSARPESFSAWGISILYAIDPPKNAFPSLHVAIATVIALAVGRSLPIAGLRRSPLETTSAGLPGNGRELAAGSWVAWAWLGAVTTSVVLVKQHYVADAIAGLAVGALVYRIGVSRVGESATPGDFERRGALALTLLGVAFYAALYAAYATSSGAAEPSVAATASRAAALR